MSVCGWVGVYYQATLSTLSWPGQRPAPSANIVVTLFVNDMNGNKVTIKIY